MIKPVLCRRPMGLIAGLVGALSVALTLGAAAPAASLQGSGTGQPGVLRGVSDLSPDDAWAVGYSCTAQCGMGSAEVDHTLILHWGGTGWSQVASPNPHDNGHLNAVTALSPSQVWAVGSYCTTHCGTGSAVFDALILHWNGTAWTQVASPTLAGSLVTTLNGVSAASPAVAWAVGTYCSVNCNQAKPAPPPRPDTFILRWDGKAWSQASSPNPGGRYGSSLDSVSALAPDNAWAAGNYGTRKSFQNFTPGNSLMLHWNGSTWARQPSPSFGNPAPGSVLYGVSALSASDALAAGSSYFGNCECARTLGLRWNGTAWTTVKTPSPGPLSDQVAEFFGVAALSPSDAWAAGYWDSSIGYLTLVAHWNGTSWAKLPSPNDPAGLKGEGNFLYAVGGASPSDAWAVGYYATSSGSSRTLILHWNGTHWTRS